MKEYPHLKSNLLDHFSRVGHHVVLGGRKWYLLKKSMQRHGIYDFVTVTISKDNHTKQRRIKRTLTYDYGEIKRMLDPSDFDGPIRLYELHNANKLPALLNRLIKVRQQYKKCFTKTGAIKQGYGQMERSLAVQDAEITKYRQVVEEILRRPGVYE